MKIYHLVYIQLLAIENDNATMGVFYNQVQAASVGIKFINRNAFYVEWVDTYGNILPFDVTVDVKLWVSSAVMQFLDHSFGIDPKRQFITDIMTINDGYKYGVSEDLYLPLIAKENREEWLDSECKQVICANCGITYDGELAHWLEGDEECPECDHVQHEHERDSIYPAS